MSGTYNKETKVFQYTVTYSGLTPTAGHFHIGAPGATGPVSIPLLFNNSAGNGFASPITGSATLTDAQATALLGNSLYANGEIRANVTAK